MNAELKRLHSPDVDDLKVYSPNESDNFAFLLQAMIGPAGSEGEESFDVFVCTPKWLSSNHDEADIILGRHHLIVFKFDYPSLTKYVARLAERCNGTSWHDVAHQLSRFGKWEFDDYRS